MKRQRNEAASNNVIMIMRLLRAGLLVSTISLLAAQQTTQPADEPIRLSVQVVLAPGTVLNRDGSYVNGLEQRHFHLLDNGKPQDISVDVAFQPISLVIAIQSNDQVEAML